MAAETYLGGSVALAAVVAVLAWGAWRLRAVLLPEWSGPPARLAEITIALTTPVLLAQVLGSAGQFRPLPMLGACLVVGIAMGVLGLRIAARRALDPSVDAEAMPRSPRFELFGAIGATAAVAAHWAAHVGEAYGRGMTHPDTLWYHAPFGVRFYRTGWLTHLNSTGLEDLAAPVHSYLPLTGSVFHSFVMMPFDSDALSLLVNVGFAALGLLAAWTLGRGLGVGALLVMATAVLLGVPTMIGTQPGQASSDIATAVLLLAAFALLREGWLEPVPTALAGLAAGLALSTKLTVAAPLLVFTVAIVVLALARPSVVDGGVVVRGDLRHRRVLDRAELDRRRQPAAVVELLPRPVPLRARCSRRSRRWPRRCPIGRRGSGTSSRASRARSARSGRSSSCRGSRGSWSASGAVERSSAPPASQGWRASPRSRSSPGSARSAGPASCSRCGTSLQSCSSATRCSRSSSSARRSCGARSRSACSRSRWSWTWSLRASRCRELAAWPDGQWVIAVVVGLLVLGVAALYLRTTGAARSRALSIVAVWTVVVVGVGGWFVQREFHQDRYVDAGLSIDDINAYFRDRSDLHVGSVGTEQLYPLFGADLSNDVSKVRVPRDGTPTEQCRAWRTALAEGGYRYLVVADELFADPGPEPEWLTGDTSTLVLVDGDARLYRLDGPLPPDGCA